MGTCSRSYWPVLLLLAAQGWSQGLVLFNNRVGTEVSAPVYGLEPANPALARQGNAQAYTGPLLAGAGFTAQLFGGPTNTPTESLDSLMPAVLFRAGDGAGFVVAPSTAVSVPGVIEGERAKVQLRAWNNRGGAITNWAQVLADPTIARGESLPIITPPLGSVFTPPPNLVGLESFNIALRIRLNALERRLDGQFELKYINPTGVPYCIEASENLRQWTAVGTMPAGSGRFTDAAATNQPHRFYRVIPCGAP